MRTKADMWLWLVITPYLLSSFVLAETSADTDECFNNGTEYISCTPKWRHYPSVCDCGNRRVCYIEFEITTSPNPCDADNWIHPYNIFRINDGYIGPTIVVKGEAIIVVDVTNKIPKGFKTYSNSTEVNDDITIHWHGMHQQGTPWMDGAGEITQYPIPSGGKFRYIFRAHPSGTHWYHSHMRRQRDEGIVGALIVLEEPEVVNKLLTFETIPAFEDMPESHTIAITEHLENSESFRACMPDGSFVPVKGELIDSFQINGIKLPKIIDITKMETYFIVEPGESYRFRVIGAMEQTALRFSIDDHKLFVIGTDGYLTEPFEIDVLHVHVGESYDFILKADNNVDRGTVFPLRIESVAVCCDNPDQPERVGIAYLKYGYNPVFEVKVHEARCPSCKALNCPFQNYPKRSFLFRNAPFFECHNVHDALRLLHPTAKEELPDATSLPLTRFFNFGDPKPARENINHVEWNYPPIPFPLIDIQQVPTDCMYGTNNQDCTKRCPHTLVINKADKFKSMRFVLSILAESTQPVTRIKTHPIHFHGHSFRVAKIAYPQYSEDGTIERVNNDIEIDTECGPGKWRNGRIPSDIEVNDTTVRKDTIIVPAGGYVVIEFKVDNPGWWFMHCHIDRHPAEGMAMAVDELSGCQNPPPPGLKNKNNKQFCFTVAEFLAREKNDKCNVSVQTISTRRHVGTWSKK